MLNGHAGDRYWIDGSRCCKRFLELELELDFKFHSISNISFDQSKVSANIVPQHKHLLCHATRRVAVFTEQYRDIPKTGC